MKKLTYAQKFHLESQLLNEKPLLGSFLKRNNTDDSEIWSAVWDRVYKLGCGELDANWEYNFFCILLILESGEI